MEKDLFKGLYTELKAIIRDSGNIKLANLKRETFHDCLVVYFHVCDIPTHAAYWLYSNQEWYLIESVYTFFCPFTFADVAKQVLDRCVVSDPNTRDPKNKEFSVVFDYSFVEDHQERRAK